MSEPLTAEELDQLRGDLDALGPKFALHEKDTRRLLATLDAARPSGDHVLLDDARAVVRAYLANDQKGLLGACSDLAAALDGRREEG